MEEGGEEDGIDEAGQEVVVERFVGDEQAGEEDAESPGLVACELPGDERAQ